MLWAAGREGRRKEEEERKGKEEEKERECVRDLGKEGKEKETEEGERVGHVSLCEWLGGDNVISSLPIVC